MFRHKRLAYLIGVLGAALFVAPAAQADTHDAIFSWFASRRLPEQTFWRAPEQTHAEELFRQSYLMAELSVLAYRSPDTDPIDKARLAPLGFGPARHLRNEKDVSASDAGHLLRIGGGDLLGAVVGESSVAAMKAEADAFVFDSLGDDVRVVAVRGTEPNLWDVALDLDAATISDDGVAYHHGFYIYASLLYEHVIAALGDACEPGGRSVYLTGHSLGGAAAEILALWLERSGCQVDGVITFAAPLPGRRNMETAYRAAGLWDRTQRWVHAIDPVPCLPFGDAWAELGHQHTVSDAGYRLNDPVDHCDVGDATIESRVYATMLKAYDLTDLSLEFEQWLEDGAEAIGVCGKKRPGVRALFGVLTLGANEGACKTLDVLTDVRSQADQLQRAALILFENRNFEAHMNPACLYIDRIVEEGEARGTFLDPIWSQRMDKTWEDHTAQCQPPAPPPPACPGRYDICCSWSGFNECSSCWDQVKHLGPCPG